MRRSCCALAQCVCGKGDESLSEEMTHNGHQCGSVLSNDTEPIIIIWCIASRNTELEAGIAVANTGTCSNAGAGPYFNTSDPGADTTGTNPP